VLKKSCKKQTNFTGIRTAASYTGYAIGGIGQIVDLDQLSEIVAEMPRNRF
jgi:hypothetical protein